MTAGSLIQSSLLARSINRNQFNKSLPLDSVQMKFFVREILDATARSRVASQGGSRRETGRNDLDAATGDPQSNLPIHAHDPTRLRHDMSGASGNIRPRRISRGRLAFIRRRKSDDTIPFAIRPTK